MKGFVLAAAAALVSSAALADRPNNDANGDRGGARSTIVVTVSGLACATPAGSGAFNARSWSWGVTNSTASTGSGAGAGKPVVGDVTIKKGFDACSSALLRAIVQGRSSATATVLQRDATGNVIASLELRNVTLSAWNVSGSAREASPDESLALSFTEVCVSGSGSTRVCFDLRTGSVS
jgi:type VI protein secretion system component Hcp